MSQSTVRWETALIQKYDRHSAPRYTSYPTAIEFTEAYHHQAFARQPVATPNGRYRSMYICLFAINSATSVLVIRLSLAKPPK
jgi:oxygen-independent coproporphyrinogen III oxidase